MRETLNPALPAMRKPLPEVRSPAPDTPAAPPPAPRRGRAPMVERIACWSARHRIAVVVGWLVLAGAALLAGQLLGTQSQPQYDPGQAGQAEQMLHQLNVVSPPQETVLIQARGSSAGRHLRAKPAAARRGRRRGSARSRGCPGRPVTSGPR